MTGGVSLGSSDDTDGVDAAFAFDDTISVEILLLVLVDCLR